MIIKAALLLFRDNKGTKELLFVRAKGKPYYVFPGGKQETDESIEDALSRELREELQVDIEKVQPLGVVSGHTPDGTPLQMNLFSGRLIGTPKPDSEIEELLWLSRLETLDRRDQMTPMTLDHVIPFLDKQGIW